MLTLDKLNQREAEIKEALRQTVARAEQMRGALECIALLKKDYEADEAERQAAEDEALAAEHVEMPEAAECEPDMAPCEHGISYPSVCSRCYEKRLEAAE